MSDANKNILSTKEIAVVNLFTTLFFITLLCSSEIFLTRFFRERIQICN